MFVAKAKSVLDPVRHKRLLEDLEHMCTIAGTPEKYVRGSMTSVCNAEEIDYVTNFRVYRKLYPGFAIIGEKVNATEKCMAISGAFIRNYIDSRVVTLIPLIDAIEAGDAPDPTVLIIPNLYVCSYGKTLPAWKVASVYDLLLSRWTANKPSVVVVEDLEALQVSYGMVFEQHLKNYKT